MALLGSKVVETRQYINPKHPEQGYNLALPVSVAEAIFADDNETVQAHLNDLHGASDFNSAAIGYLKLAADNVKPLIMNVALTNTDDLPLYINNSKTAVNFPTGKNRNNLDYTVQWELVSATGGDVGEVAITQKQLNGFQIEYTGSASSVTLKLYITGGLV
jgi:hypothetical protein